MTRRLLSPTNLAHDLHEHLPARLVGIPMLLAAQRAPQRLLKRLACITSSMCACLLSVTDSCANGVAFASLVDECGSVSTHATAAMGRSRTLKREECPAFRAPASRTTATGLPNAYEKMACDSSQAIDFIDFLVGGAGFEPATPAV